MNERRGRIKVCRFCEDKIEVADYKDERLLRRFVNERSRIFPRRGSGTCARHQRIVAAAIKRARQIALLAFAEDSVR